MNVRKKESRSMRRNNYLPVTRDPRFKRSLSLLAFSICQTSHHGKSLKGSTDREMGREPGGGRQHLLLQESAGGSAQKQQPYSHRTHQEGKTETLNRMIQAPKSLYCSPQPPSSPPSPFQLLPSLPHTLRPLLCCGSAPQASHIPASASTSS